MSGAPGKAHQRSVADGGFAAFVEALLCVVRRDTDVARRVSADLAHREALRLEGRVRIPAVPSQPAAMDRTGIDMRVQGMTDAIGDRAAALGLGLLAQVWPQGSRDSLHTLLAEVDAVVCLWGARAQDASRPETVRTRLALQDRCAEAVRYASAAMYEAARAARIPGDDVDRAAAEFARALGDRIFGDPGAVFAAPRGPIVAAEHELQHSGAASGRIRCLAFGIRHAAAGAMPGAIRCKAIVGPDGVTEEMP